RKGAPGVERERHMVRRTDPAVHREQRLLRGNVWHAREDGPGALGQVREEALEISRRRDLLAPSGERFRGHHARTPSRAHAKGSTVASASCAAAAAAAASRTRKNMHPPAPDPAALPPSA